MSRCFCGEKHPPATQTLTGLQGIIFDGFSGGRHPPLSPKWRKVRRGGSGKWEVVATWFPLLSSFPVLLCILYYMVHNIWCDIDM